MGFKSYLWKAWVQRNFLQGKKTVGREVQRGNVQISDIPWFIQGFSTTIFRFQTGVWQCTKRETTEKVKGAKSRGGLWNTLVWKFGWNVSCRVAPNFHQGVRNKWMKTFGKYYSEDFPLTWASHRSPSMLWWRLGKWLRIENQSTCSEDHMTSSQQKVQWGWLNPETGRRHY